MAQLNKILLIRLSSIGDVILASPLIRVLRSTFPDALIDFIVKSEYADLVRFNPHLSAVFELRTKTTEELRAMRRKIRSERYDAIFDIHDSLRSRALRLFSGAKHVGVVNKRKFERFLLVNLKRNYYKEIVSVPERYFETAERFGVGDDGRGLEVFIPEETEFAVTSRLSNLKLDRQGTVIGLAPTARHFTKRWPMERFVELGVKAGKEPKTRLLILGGREDEEYCGDIAHMINTELGSGVAENYAGKLSLLETASALDWCTLVVSNDSGLMHLAAARKKKVVAIFGSTVEEFGFFPFGVENIVVENEEIECRPCSHIGLNHCPEGHFKCMKELSAAAVLDAAHRLLAREPVR